jgi:cell division control protein 6
MPIDAIKIDEELQRSAAGVFENPSVFGAKYVPPKFFYRKEEVQRIMDNAKSFYNQLPPEHIHAHGPPGTGKSAIARATVNAFNNLAGNLSDSHQFIYVNVRHLTYPKVLYNIASVFDDVPRHGVGASDYMDRIAKHMKHSRFGLIFDEADRIIPSYPYLTPIDEILNQFTRTSEIYGNECFVMLISNDKNILKNNASDATMSTFCPDVIYFSQYNANEMSVILWDRCRIGFKANVVERDTICDFAHLLSDGSRDLRVGMRVLLRAGKEASQKGQGTITITDLEDALNYVEKDVLFDMVAKLDDQQLLWYGAVATIQYKSGSATADAVYREYLRLVRQVKNMEELKYRHIINYIRHKMEAQGLFRTKIRGKETGGRELVFVVDEDEVSDVILAVKKEVSKRFT